QLSSDQLAQHFEKTVFVELSLASQPPPGRPIITEEAQQGHAACAAHQVHTARRSDKPIFSPVGPREDSPDGLGPARQDFDLSPEGPEVNRQRLNLVRSEIFDELLLASLRLQLALER